MCVGQRKSLYPVEGVSTLLAWHPWSLNIGWSLVFREQLPASEFHRVLSIHTETYSRHCYLCFTDDVVPVSSTSQTLDILLCIIHLTLHHHLGMVYHDSRCRNTFITFLCLLKVMTGDANSARRNL